MKKEIKRILSNGRQKIGEHYMHQPLPNNDFASIDPFLLLHHHGPHEFEPYNQGLPFGPHPHRGFETLTFIYEGSIEHADSQGFKSVINPGGVQWMTAGRGIVHSENIPETMRENGGKMEIIQLWMNLPGKLKMTAPNYQGFQKEEIPLVISEDGLIKTQVISGEVDEKKGPAKSITELTILNVVAHKAGKQYFKIAKNENILFYVLNGEILVNGKLAINNQLVDFANKGEDIEIEAQENSRFVIAYGKPLDEPVVSQGPFVMNTTTEIMQAMRDYQMGKMGIM
ncbi:pirin family protein [uncultured Arcticibacterium sp.]|uniref:pirin family protein n=1 Tax=uncultured Arcticibacterium sp. TaxID=2173042 RepID=UPI0030F6DC75